MFRIRQSFFVAALCLCLSPLTAWADAVLTGSTYNVSLRIGNTVTPIPPATVTFDGVAESFTSSFNNAQITINESQASLGGDQHQISFIITSDAEMFPDIPGSTFAGINIGGFSSFLDPINLNLPLNLTSVILAAKNQAGTTLGSFEFISLIGTPAPWDGFFSQPNTWGGFGNGQGFNVRQLDLTITGTAVPLPSAASAGLGLLGGLACLRAKRRRSERR